MTKHAEILHSTERSFVDSWRAANGEASNGAHPGFPSVRRAAIERFARVGLPVEKEEAWKYTNIRRLVDAWAGVDPVAPLLESALELSGRFIAGDDAIRIVVVNGRFEPSLSRIDGEQTGLTVSSLSEAACASPELFLRSFGSVRPGREDGLTSLNTAFAKEGVFVHVARGCVLDRPVEFVYVSTGGFVQPRALCVVDAGASARFVESWTSMGSGPVFTNAVVEFVVDRDASVDHVRVVDEEPGSVHVHHLEVRQLATSVFSTASFIFGGGTVRSDAYLLPDAEHCETHLFGFYFGRGDMHVDNHTMVDHARPNCQSNELYKGILDGRAVCVFNGKVLVRQDAQKTNAYQSNKSVILSETARMYSKPELEIYADDVKCSHGATTGKLDDEAYFYLRSRGIRPARARLLLLQAFAGDVFATLKDEDLRARLLGRLEALLFA